MPNKVSSLLLTSQSPAAPRDTEFWYDSVTDSLNFKSPASGIYDLLKDVKNPKIKDITNADEFYQFLTSSGGSSAQIGIIRSNFDLAGAPAWTGSILSIPVSEPKILLGQSGGSGLITCDASIKANPIVEIYSNINFLRMFNVKFKFVNNPAANTVQLVLAGITAQNCTFDFGTSGTKQLKLYKLINTIPVSGALFEGCLIDNSPTLIGDGAMVTGTFQGCALSLIQNSGEFLYQMTMNNCQISGATTINRARHCRFTNCQFMGDLTLNTPVTNADNIIAWNIFDNCFFASLASDGSISTGYTINIQNSVQTPNNNIRNNIASNCYFGTIPTIPNPDDLVLNNVLTF
jgi:hypothetical protein